MDDLFWRTPASASIAELIRADIFTQAIGYQTQLNKAFQIPLDVFLKQQESISKNINHDMIRAIGAYPSITEALERSIHASAMLRQPLIGMSVPFAAQEKAFSQMARISIITTLQETWAGINNLIPAVQISVPKADMTLEALAYIEKNRPDICLNVDKVLSSSVDEHQSVDSLDGYIALCEEVSANLAILYSTVDSSDLAKGIACLAIIFADLLIYLRYCKSLKEKETA